MKPTDNNKWFDEALTEIIGSKKSTTDFEQWKKQHPQAVDMLTSRAFRQHELSNPLTTRSTLMKSQVAKLTAAAAIILAVTLGLFEFIDTDSKSGSVWAEVVRKVEDSRGVIYRTRKIGIGDPNDDWPKGHIIYNRSPLHYRTDRYKEGQIYRTMNFNLSTKTRVWLAHDAKIYDKKPMTEEAIQSVQRDQNQWLNPEDFISRALSVEHREIESKIINDILCQGLETNDPAVCGAPPTKTFVARLWVSVETGYPVLIEVEATDGEDGGVRMKGYVDEFQWDIEFGPDDRQISIPPDFHPL